MFDATLAVFTAAKDLFYIESIRTIADNKYKEKK